MGADADQERAGQQYVVTYAFDLPTELELGVRDAEGTWRFISRFAAACGQPLARGDGCDDAELFEAEERLGLALPTSMRHLYRLIGRRDDLTGVHDRLLRADQLRVDEMGQVLVFRLENQALARWGIEIAAVGEHDPPVVYQPYTDGSSTPQWQPFLRYLSWACLEMVLSESLFSEAGYGDTRQLDDATVIALESQFSRLPLPDYPWWAEPFGAPTRWFYGLGGVLRADARLWLWAHATSADAMRAIRRALPGGWIMIDDR